MNKYCPRVRVWKKEETQLTIYLDKQLILEPLKNDQITRTFIIDVEGQAMLLWFLRMGPKCTVLAYFFRGLHVIWPEM